MKERIAGASITRVRAHRSVRMADGIVVGRIAGSVLDAVRIPGVPERIASRFAHEDRPTRSPGFRPDHEPQIIDPFSSNVRPRDRTLNVASVVTVSYPEARTTAVSRTRIRNPGACHSSWVKGNRSRAPGTGSRMMTRPATLVIPVRPLAANRTGPPRRADQ